MLKLIKQTGIMLVERNQDDFYVVIIPTVFNGTKCLDLYLGHRDYGVLDLMFGLLTEPTDTTLLDIIEANIDEYIESYKADHFETI
jgi:hypothetical protein